MKAKERSTSTPQASERRKTVCVEDPALTMIEPDTMTPSQFFDRVFTETTMVPEKRLMLAVLEDAIASFQRNFIQCTDDSDELHDDDVEAWLESDDMSWPFSFASICQALNMEPEYLRKGLRNWRIRAEQQGKRGQVYRFPFRRVNGRRHSINAKRDRRKRKAG
ncbi:MAG: hypothetical protein D6815_08705 [Candidatus Dadabacteria bacterium]|nr:MAG: hypothetical protein D6815_08705 [Candidatus Dadabacteria bacterium]